MIVFEMRKREKSKKRKKREERHKKETVKGYGG
jgi:hypothetical protein